MAGGGLAAELGAVGCGCDAGVVVGYGELPGVDVVDGLEAGGVDDGSYGDAVGGVVGGLDGGIGRAGAVSVEADGPGWWSVGVCGRCYY